MNQQEINNLKVGDRVTVKVGHSKSEEWEVITLDFNESQIRFNTDTHQTSPFFLSELKEDCFVKIIKRYNFKEMLK